MASNEIQRFETNRTPDSKPVCLKASFFHYLLRHLCLNLTLVLYIIPFSALKLIFYR